LLTRRQTDKVWQKHNLLGGGNYAVFAGFTDESIVFVFFAFVLLHCF